MTTIDVTADSYDSRLYYYDNPDGDDCILLELRVRVHVAAAPAGPYSFRATLPGPTPGSTVTQMTTLQVGQWNSGHVTTFKNQFRDAIYRHWNGRLWCAHSGPQTYRHRVYTMHNWNIRCGVHLDFVDDPDDAQLCILMIYQPTGPGAAVFRASCALGGTSRPPGPRSWFSIGDNPVDMRVTDTAASQDVTRRLAASDATSSYGCYDFVQNTAVHEFGHYLGLSHTCASTGGLNSSAQYCAAGTIAQQSNRMAAGNDVSAEHAWPWRNRIPRHRYLPEYSWRGRTSAPPTHRG